MQNTENFLERISSTSMLRQEIVNLLVLQQELINAHMSMSIKTAFMNKSLVKMKFMFCIVSLL